MLEMLGPLVAAGSSLLGGLLNRNAATENNERNIALQKEFAQSGIQWKVADAKAAGIHPLAALGAQTMSFQPQQVGSSMGSAVSSMGQDIGRAINATRTSSQRDEMMAKTMQEMNLQNMTLRNDLIAAQIAKLRAGSNPPMPNATSEGDMVTTVNRDPKGPKERTRLVLGGTEINTDRGTSDANEFTNRYGEGLGDWVFGPYIAWRDFNTHSMIPASNRFEERRMRWHGQKPSFMSPSVPKW